MKVIRNAKRNILHGSLNRIILLLCPFLERTIIRYILGAQYLGLGSLFVSVLQVLSLSELGFGSAMIYNLYKPIAEGDTDQVNRLLAYYRKVYRIIGCVILGLGALISLFLKELIHDTLPPDVNLYLLYGIYVGNSALSYFLFAYLSSLLTAHQREDVRSSVNSAVKIGLTAAQVLLLVTTRNYLLFAAAMPVFTVVNNLWVAWRVKKLYPQYKPCGMITSEERKPMRKLVAGTFIQQLCGTTRNSLDSICISAFLGLTLTAIYNNYYLIFSGLCTLLGVISAAFTGGVGNHVAMKSPEENFREMKKLDFLYLWLGGWTGICLLCLYQPFMELWMGADMLLPLSAVILLVIYYYLMKLGDIRLLYSSAKGLWWEQRYRAIGETVVNLALNVVLGKFFGVHGIIAATMISLFFCNYIWSVSITFRCYFGLEKRRDYYLYQAKQTGVILLAAAFTWVLAALPIFSSTVITLIYRGILCVVIPNVIFWLVYRKSEDFTYAKSVIFRREYSKAN